MQPVPPFSALAALANREAMGKLTATQGLEKLCSRTKPAWLMVWSVVTVLLVGVIDWVTGPQISFAVFYLIPVTFAAWFIGRKQGMAVAGLSALVWLLAEAAYFEPTARAFAICLWNACARLGIFIFVVLMLSNLRQVQAGLEETIVERTRQLESEVTRRLKVQEEIVAISHRERQRIGHELHDGLGQHLAGIALRAKALEQALARQDLHEAPEAGELSSLVRQAMGQVRNLARGLDPIDLEDNDLVAALQNLAAEASRSLGIACTLRWREAASLLPVKKETALALYRISQEAITNAVTHGAARQVLLELADQDGALQLRVHDDGTGFTLAPEPATGMGLHIMRYRAEAIGATLEIRSEPGQGTEVCCVLSAPVTSSLQRASMHENQNERAPRPGVTPAE